jgi:NitT/TauT family transport system permease protein
MQTMAQITMRYLPLVLLALVWEAAARLHVVDTSALPPLSKVAVAWFDLMRDGELINNGAASLYRGSAGLLLAVIFGGGLGLWMARWRLLDVFVNPLVELFYPLPKSALIPVTVLWLGFGDGSKILLIFLGCMIPVTIGAYNGARGSDHVLVGAQHGSGPTSHDVGRGGSERAAGTAQRRPHRAGARLHPAGEFRADRLAKGLWLPDRLSRLDRIV